MCSFRITHCTARSAAFNVYTMKHDSGKIIMIGLYIREMLTRRLISRVLIVSPAGLAVNWEHEMHILFNFPFTIVAGIDARGALNH